MKALGKKTQYVFGYDPSLLETFANSHPDNDYWVRFNCLEFTSLCPVTSQPDFATVYIRYIPGLQMVESKSLKLYLFGFRNHGAFHEDCVNIIMKDLVRLMEPKYIEVSGVFNVRGGISIYPWCNHACNEPPYREIAKYRLMNYDLMPHRAQICEQTAFDPPEK
ncbi:MAG: preQ(1) synthase [Bacteroidales bacterium]|jgi:7-cyano-7-deazaguanine reductase|nr:preQ(1) synthase [Bacteroidales bacterium]